MTESQGITRDAVTAGILAGGEGRRLGGIDKGWYAISGRSLIERTIDRVRPQCEHVLISANRSLAQYRALGWRAVADDSDDQRGPLAGIAAVLKAATTPFVLLVPVDTPLLPLNLCEELAAAMRPDTDVVVARSPGGRHPLHALVRRNLLDDVQSALFGGVRRVADWQDGTRMRLVDWPDDAAFANVNTPDEAVHVAEWLSQE